MKTTDYLTTHPNGRLEIYGRKQQGGRLSLEKANPSPGTGPEKGMRLGLKKGAATYSPACAVPSARLGLTSLFGMGRGGTPTL